MVSDQPISIAVEDRFLIFTFGMHDGMFPAPSNDLELLGNLLTHLSSTGCPITPVFDLRCVEDIYNDVDDFLNCVAGETANVLLNEGQMDRDWLEAKGIVALRSGATSYAHHELDWNSHVRSCDDIANDLILQSILQSECNPMTKRGRKMWAECHRRALNDYAPRFLSFLEPIRTQSLLVEYVMSSRANQIELAPYHSHAIHEVETPNNSVLIGRPAAIAQSTMATFSHEISEFDRLINDPDTRERHLQTFLEEHPNFLRGLNYQDIYPQIVLERDDDGPLMPDFILEPFDDSFCDILDLKLPSQNLFVGRKDRATLAAAIHEVAAQLREYAAYFEQDRHRKFVRDKYGLRVYRPRLIAVVGRDMKQMQDEQFRRAITQYVDLQVMTFDELLVHSKRRLLV